MIVFALGALLHCSTLGKPHQHLAALPLSEPMSSPFWVPPDMADFVNGRIAARDAEQSRAEALLHALLLPGEQGGMGIEFSNSRTRTINETWAERKANCISFTMAYVMLAKQLGINAVFAESFDVTGWSRTDNLIIREKHMVALVMTIGQGDLVADFLPRVIPRYGNYFVGIISDGRAKAYYFLNLAVEAINDGDAARASENVLLAIDADPTASQAWNVKGVIEKLQNYNAAAERSFISAISNNPNDVAAISNLASIYEVEGLIDDAARLRALERRLRRRDPYYFAFLAQEAFQENNFKKARRLIRNAINIHPSDADFYITQSRIFLALNNSKAALAALARARSYAAMDWALDLETIIEELRAGLPKNVSR